MCPPLDGPRPADTVRLADLDQQRWNELMRWVANDAPQAYLELQPPRGASLPLFLAAQLRRCSESTRVMAGLAVEVALRNALRDDDRVPAEGAVHLAFLARIARDDRPYVTVMQSPRWSRQVRMRAALALVDRDVLPDLADFAAIDLSRDEFLAHAVAEAYAAAAPEGLLPALKHMPDCADPDRLRNALQIAMRKRIAQGCAVASLIEEGLPAWLESLASEELQGIMSRIAPGSSSPSPSTDRRGRAAEEASLEPSERYQPSLSEPLIAVAGESDGWWEIRGSMRSRHPAVPRPILESLRDVQ